MLIILIQGWGGGQNFGICAYEILEQSLVVMTLVILDKIPSWQPSCVEGVRVEAAKLSCTTLYHTALHPS